MLILCSIPRMTWSCTFFLYLYRMTKQLQLYRLRKMLMFSAILTALLTGGTQLSAQKNNVSEAINKQFACYLEGENNGEVLRNFAAFFLSTEEFQQVISYAGQLKSLGEKNNNTRYRAYANAYLGQAYLMTNQNDIAKMYLNQALRQAKSIQNDSILCSVYNGLGLFASNVESDYNSSISYYFSGIEAAKRCSHKRLYNILLCNIAGVYYLKGDSTGLKYAQECYNFGHSQNDPFLALWGAVNSARMYIVMEKYEEAFKYIKEAEFILQKNQYNDQTNVFTLYGEILVALGDNTEAEKYYKEALKNIGHAQTSSIANIYLSYGKLLAEQKRYSEAVPLFEKGIKVSKDGQNQIFIKQLFAALSECYEKMQRFDKSLEYFKIYHTQASRDFNEESERSINQLRIKFDAQRKENEAEQARLEVLNKTRKMQFLIIILVMAVGVAIYLYILYVNKNRLYRRIIIRDKEAIKREDDLKNQLKNFATECPNVADKYSVSSLKEDKIENIFQKIEYIMHEEKLYHDPTLTKEKIADKLNTNRTYLSQVINERTGLTVPHYINTFRINEAVRILSDSEDDTPLKALAFDLGFNSMSTFYKVFQASVGMTPSLYRKKVQEISS